MSSKYTTIQGDTWDSIAKSQMGGERYMAKLMQANTSYIHTVIFSGGKTLTIPDVDAAIPSILPPWKQVS